MYALLILGLFISSNAYACPDLSGYYDCVFTEDSDNNIGDLERQAFTQTTKNGLTTYSYNNGLIFRTDNKVYLSNYYKVETKVQASCPSASTLNARLRWKRDFYNPDITNIKLDRTWKKLSNGKIYEKAVLTQLNKGYWQRGTFYKECELIYKEL